MEKTFYLFVQMDATGMPVVVSNNGICCIKCDMEVDSLCNGDCVAKIHCNSSWNEVWHPDIISLGFSWNAGTVRWLMDYWHQGEKPDCICGWYSMGYGTNAGKTPVEDLIRMYLQHTLRAMWIIAYSHRTVKSYYDSLEGG